MASRVLCKSPNVCPSQVNVSKQESRMTKICKKTWVTPGVSYLNSFFEYLYANPSTLRTRRGSQARVKEYVVMSTNDLVTAILKL